jgi:hypothetical protein
VCAIGRIRRFIATCAPDCFRPIGAVVSKQPVSSVNDDREAAQATEYSCARLGLERRITPSAPIRPTDQGCEVRWLGRLAKVLGFVILVFLSFELVPIVGILTAAWIGDTTGWYRVEDYMCTLPEGCKEYIAERKRLREKNRLQPKSN